MRPGAADKIVIGNGLGDRQVLGDQAGTDQERQGQDDDPETAVPLHPGAGEKKGNRPVFHGPERGKTGCGAPGNGFKKGVDEGDARRHDRVRHDEWGENKEEGDQHHDLVVLHPGRGRKRFKRTPSPARPAITMA